MIGRIAMYFYQRELMSINLITLVKLVAIIVPFYFFSLSEQIALYALQLVVLLSNYGIQIACLAILGLDNNLKRHVCRAIFQSCKSLVDHLNILERL